MHVRRYNVYDKGACTCTCYRRRDVCVGHQQHGSMWARAQQRVHHHPSQSAGVGGHSSATDQCWHLSLHCMDRHAHQQVPVWLLTYNAFTEIKVFHPLLIISNTVRAVIHVFEGVKFSCYSRFRVLFFRVRGCGTYTYQRVAPLCACSYETS